MKILVIDIGGTFIKYACMKEDMSILLRGKIDTPKNNREELIETIGKIYDEIPEIDGISISMPGIIDSENGYCVMGGALRYNDNFYLKNSLYKRCPVKIHIENNAKCAGIAEATIGNLKDVKDGFVLIFGTMIGGAFIKDHKLHKGKHFSAGEVSYINTEKDGTPNMKNIWGNRCSVPKLCSMYAEKKGLNIECINGVKFFEAVKNHDVEAVECLEKFTKEIAVQIFNIQNILDIEKFAIGGGISSQPLFIEYIKKNLKSLYDECPYYVSKAEVVSCKFHNNANLIGALQCFINLNLIKN